jgi:hypothetical protein
MCPCKNSETTKWMVMKFTVGNCMRHYQTFALLDKTEEI